MELSQMFEIRLMTTLTLVFGEATFFVAVQTFKQACDLFANNLLRSDWRPLTHFCSLFGSSQLR
jgi:hypothetical protein